MELYAGKCTCSHLCVFALFLEFKKRSWMVVVANANVISMVAAEAALWSEKYEFDQGSF